jgi:hypothetical protein
MKMNSKHTPQPCNFDHNLECLICDCWIDACGFKRLVHNDYKYENREELIEIFKPTFEEFFKIYDLGYEAGIKAEPVYSGQHKFVFVIGYCDGEKGDDSFYKKLERRNELRELMLERFMFLETFSNC